jgi:CRISPR-associated endonuclease/helicase Cas3
MTKSGLYRYQRRVCDLVLGGRPVVLQAPTGAGKTRAALEPFFEAFVRELPFPRQAIYSVPMRTLANQFHTEHRRALQDRPSLGSLRATIQTGEQPEDPELWGDLVFTTIDQTLSNWLCLPYSLGAGRANLNAGAVVGSYLIFDEFHLFPVDDPAKGNGARVTTLALLKALNDLVPWVLMTATFSRRLLDRLCEMLRAERVLTEPQDLAEIPSQRDKERRFVAKEKCLEARDVLDAHSSRSIAVCNTVDRAVELYGGLCGSGCRPVPFSEADSLEEIYDRLLNAQNGVEPYVMLLHSRFEQRHRKLKEELVLREFGNDKAAQRIPSLILVATQLVEVGLNITCETLHTEIAPASSVLQRAGRCARFPGQKGEVRIYDVPDTGNLRYVPYTGADGEACRKAWDAFRARTGAALDFLGEQEVIDEVHTSADEALLEAMQRRELELCGWITDAICNRELARRRDLIRQIDHRTLLVHDEPGALGDPFRCEGFSIWFGTLKGWFEKARNDKSIAELPWLLQYPQEDAQQEPGQRVSYCWKPVSNETALCESAVFAVNPRAVSYTAETGLRFGPSRGDYRSAPPRQAHVSGSLFQYRQEPYPEHIRRMVSICEKRIAPRLHYLFEALENRLNVEPGTLLRTMRVILATHDAGKLSRDWQGWAHEYQRRIGRPVPDEVALAHTDRFTEEHRDIEQRMKARRPNHAVEGARCCLQIVCLAAGRSEAVCKAALMAIAKHHAPDAEQFARTELIPSAREVLAEALRTASPHRTDLAVLASSLRSVIPQSGTLGRHLLHNPIEDRWDPWFVYFLLVRALRLADGASLEENRVVAHD